MVRFWCGFLRFCLLIIILTLRNYSGVYLYFINQIPFCGLYTFIKSPDDTFIKSPLNQVETYKYNLFQLHSEELFLRSVKNKNNWATVNCTVYFHNATQKELNDFLLKDFQSEKYSGYKKFVSYFGLLGKDSLNENSLNQLLSKFWLNRQSYYFDETLYKSIRRYLKPPLHQIDEGVEINYTKEQRELTRSEIRPRRKIKGVAGSGKTLVLAKRAVNAHIRTEQKVLVLTYNLSLKNYIHDKISDVREKFSWSNFYITNYHQFFKTQANNFNLGPSNIKDWQDVDFFEQVKDSIQKFDVVLIDEVQDYLQSWIDIITKYFIHNKTEFVVFGDEKQNIYNRQLDENKEPIVRTIPGVWNKTLNTSHRFSSNIGNLAIKFQKEIFKQKYNLDEINVFSQLNFEKRIIEYHTFNNYTAQDLLNVIFDVLKRNEIHSSDAGVLCSKVELLRELDFLIRTKRKEKTATTFESKEEYEKIKKEYEKIKDNIKKAIEKLRRTKKNHFWMKTGTLKLSTTHSFKGWEVNTLFLFIEKFIEKKQEDKDFTNEELVYTALTRAKRNLIVFNLGNQKYDSFFKREISTCIDHKL